MNIRTKWEQKKESCIKRCIDFNISLEEYTALWQLRNHSDTRCAYTGVKFNIKKLGNDNYPELERIDSNLCYSVDNCLYVTKYSNSVKCKYIEQEKSIKGVPNKDITTTLRIRKLLNNPESLERIKQPYKDAVANINLVEDNKQKRIAKENKIMMDAQQMKDKAQLEVDFALHYVNLVTELTDMGATVQCSIGELRKKIINTKKCQITGKPFNNLSEKKLYILDKSANITKDNMKVVLQSTRDSLDVLLVGGSAKTLTRNLKKIL